MSDDTIVYHSNQFFVSLEDSIMEDTILAFLEDLNAVEIWKSGKLNMALWEVIGFPFTTGDGETIIDIHDAISRSKRKTKIHNASLNIQQTINSALAFEGATCFDITQLSKVQGDSSEIKISILDTGISDISDNSTANYNYNLTNYSGYDYIHNDAIPDDENGHGTHLAGIIHSITHQHIPTQNRITFDIRKTHDAAGQAFLSTIVMALLDALDADANIVNMSFGYQGVYHDSLFFPLQVVIEEAWQNKVLVVIAGGNGTINNDLADTIALPASFPTNNILSVASLDCGNNLSLFSNYGGASVDLAVLGENIPGPNLASGLVEYSGTSQAAALITAVSALKATYIVQYTPEKVICPLLQTAEHLFELADKVLADGKLNFDGLFLVSDSTCLQTGFHCNKNYTGSDKLTGTMASPMMTETNLQIQSDQNLELGSLVTLDALQSTTLLPGFEVTLGATLQIRSNGCEE
ncbi:MAG: S8 family serine peptidase [Saprospiraceae bacterium]|nr:S8 family serine peptidase [Saprospiraceae bacterium]